MLAKKHCSLNWGKSASLVLLVTLVVLMVVAVLVLNQTAPDVVAIDWGESFAPLRIKEPVLPPMEPVAIDWGESFAPLRIKEPVVLF